jgi:hypothetical protein
LRAAGAVVAPALLSLFEGGLPPPSFPPELVDAGALLAGALPELLALLSLLGGALEAGALEAGALEAGALDAGALEAGAADPPPPPSPLSPLLAPPPWSPLGLGLLSPPECVCVAVGAECEEP